MANTRKKQSQGNVIALVVVVALVALLIIIAKML